MVKHVSMLTDILDYIAKKMKNSSSGHVQTSICNLIQIWRDPKSKALLLGRLKSPLQGAT